MDAHQRVLQPEPEALLRQPHAQQILRPTGYRHLQERWTSTPNEALEASPVLLPLPAHFAKVSQPEPVHRL